MQAKSIIEASDIKLPLDWVSSATSINGRLPIRLPILRYASVPRYCFCRDNWVVSCTITRLDNKAFVARCLCRRRSREPWFRTGSRSTRVVSCVRSATVCGDRRGRAAWVAIAVITDHRESSRSAPHVRMPGGPQNSTVLKHERQSSTAVQVAPAKCHTWNKLCQPLFLHAIAWFWRPAVPYSAVKS